MMIDWSEYHKEIGSRLGELMKLSPDTVRGYQTLSAANTKTGKLDEKTRQLISLACAVTTRCDERRSSTHLFDACPRRGRRQERPSQNSVRDALRGGAKCRATRVPA